MFRKLFRIRPKKFLGIDIGTSYIKVVELRRKGSGARLENYGELGILYPKKKPFRIFEKDTLLLSDQDVAVVIQKICQEAGVQTKEVNFSIPDFATFFTTFKIPEMTKDEIPEAIQHEARPYIPLPFSEITLDWVVIEGEPGRTPLKVLVAAIPNDVIRQYEEIARIARLNLKTLEPEVFALARSLKPLWTKKNGDNNKVFALIDIGARSTTFNILEQGVLKLSHSFSIGSNELTEMLARALNISSVEADDLKAKKGIAPAVGSEKDDNVRELLLPLVDNMISETKKIFRTFFQNEGKEVEKIVLAGGIAFLPGLKDYFAQELQRETLIADPFSGISYPSALAETLKNSGPSFAVAVGLALKGFE